MNHIFMCRRAWIIESINLFMHEICQFHDAWHFFRIDQNSILFLCQWQWYFKWLLETLGQLFIQLPNSFWQSFSSQSKLLETQSCEFLLFFVGNDQSKNSENLRNKWSLLWKSCPCVWRLENRKKDKQKLLSEDKWKILNKEIWIFEL